MEGAFSSGTVRRYQKVYGGTERLVWRGQITFTDATGKRHHYTKILKDAGGRLIPCYPEGSKDQNKGKNLAEGALKRWREELVAEQAKKEKAAQEAAALEEQRARRETKLDGVTVSQFMDEYIAGLRESKHVEGSTLTGYVSTARRIKAGLGDRLVAELDSKQIQVWEDALQNQEGLSGRTVTKVHRLLSQALRSAVIAGQLDDNPCAGGKIKLPKAKREQPHALTRNQANDLLATLATMPQTRVVAAARISLLSGMRLGEVCALTWGDVDRGNGLIRITQAVGSGEGGAYLKRPKNSYSVREVPLTPQLIAALQARMAKVQEEARMALDGAELSPAEMSHLYVLGDLHGNIPSPTGVTREWRQFRELFGITDSKGNPLRFHDLRHTWATIAVQSGADIKSISACLGHSNAAMTLDVYASSDTDAKKIAARKFSEYLGDTPPHGLVKQLRATGTE